VSKDEANGADDAEEADAEAPASGPRSVQEALARARRHARASLAEAVAMLRALLDAAALAATGVPSDEQQRLSGIAATLDALAAQIAPDGAGDGAPLLAAVYEALDDEIERWEERSRDDSNARPVLRAFLGLREILWELGVRPTQPAGGAGPAQPARGGRVQRVPVES
jgi:hypothetical protein